MSRWAPFYPALLGFIGALLVAGAAFWASYRQSDFNSQLKAKNAEITRLQQEVISYITGGDNYFSINVLQYPAESPQNFHIFGLLEGSLPHSLGKYPLDNVSIEIINAEQPTAPLFSQTFGVKTNIQNNLINVPVPVGRDYIIFSATVFIKAGPPYRQIFVMKKHANGVWYAHSIRMKDIYGHEVREDEFQSGYPEELKNNYPLLKDYYPQFVHPLQKEVLDQMKNSN